MLTLGTLRTRALVGVPGGSPGGSRGGPGSLGGPKPPTDPEAQGPLTDAGAQGFNLIDRWLLVYT